MRFPLYFSSLSLSGIEIRSCDGENPELNPLDDEETKQDCMEEVPGSFGTSASFALRFGQAVFSSASLLFMCFDVDFYSYTAFCFLVTIMGLMTPWSVILGLLDAYSIFVKRMQRYPRVLLIIIVGDCILSFLSLAAACSTASVTDLLIDIGGPICHEKLCGRYQLSAAMAFLSWFLSVASSLFNLWLLPSL